MSQAITLQPLESKFWSKDKLQHSFILTLVGFVALVLASKLSIPFIPVPLSLQSATVVLIGMIYGPRQGAYVIATYLLAGACGLPVFADNLAGIMKFFSPTAGYLFGFLPAVLVSGYLARIGFAKNFLTSFVAAVISDSIIFGLGLVVLMQFVGFEQAIAVGFVPFILAEIVKLVFVSALVPKFWKPSI